MIDIEQILAERPFEMLTQTEQKAVLAHMPEWEYQRLHQLVLRSKTALRQSPKPNPAIRQQLLEALRNQPKQQPQTTGLFVRMAQHRLPAWQVAAGLALLLAAHFALQKTPAETLRTETVYVNTTDTIYKEVAIPVADTSSKRPQRRVNVRPSFASKKQLAVSPTEALADSSSRLGSSATGLPDTLPGFQFSIHQPNGRSANEMKELWQFLGEVY